MHHSESSEKNLNANGAKVTTLFRGILYVLPPLGHNMSNETKWFECQRTHCDALLPLYAERCGECEWYQRWSDELMAVCPNCDSHSSVTGQTCRCGEPLSRWDSVIQVVNTFESGQDIAVSKQGISDPEVMPDFRPSIGLDTTPAADYRLELNTGSGLHIKEYDRVYEVHWDEIDPAVDPIGHCAVDATVPTAIAAFASIAYLSASSS